MSNINPETYFHGPMWEWFELSYSTYLVIPRTLLCGMPLEWQERMVVLLDEAKTIYESSTINDNYTVILKDKQRFAKDPYRNYRHPPALPYKTTV